jgi:glyoxylase-like metal-dependent hydrolase (beta-lactamase superfamily II)
MMNLEDHIGDVIRKARLASGVEESAVAKAAGIDAATLQELERSGRSITPPKWDSLASAIGLAGRKLTGLSNGWQPEPVDLANWREIRVVTTSREGNSVNCYLIWDEVSREAAVFDTGWDAAPLLDLIQQNELQLKHLFLTHTHEDHIAGMGGLRERFPKLHLHTNSKSAPPQHRNRANDFLHLGSLRITNRETPGHAEDGVIYIVGNWPEDAPHVALVGDTIFAGSMATGFQSPSILKQKIEEQIFSLPADTLLCPGHGPLTTVEQEKGHNPFFGASVEPT